VSGPLAVELVELFIYFCLLLLCKPSAALVYPDPGLWIEIGGYKVLQVLLLHGAKLGG
jgi:hypothetical protein